jgi:hypothetical protein
MAASKLNRAVKLYGTEIPDAKRRVLTAGPITATLDNGALRTICYRGVEVLRGIAYLSRDKNWGTYAPAIEGLKVRQSGGEFTVSYAATCRDREQAISYVAAIKATAAGTLSFKVDARPLTDFTTNRTGFVVLHPLVGVVGEPLEIVHTNGKKERTRFPKFISPGQPAFEIRSMKHKVMPGVAATVLMEGNKFEMEDHRNWMDASYKTYVCSLLDPWPYTLKKGEHFSQSITLTIEGRPAARQTRSEGPTIRVDLGGISGHLPAIGAGIAMSEAAAALRASPLIAAATPSHLVCQIDGRRDGQVQAAEAFRTLKDRTGARLTLEIVLPAKKAAAEEMAEIALAVKDAGLKLDAVVVTQAHDLKSFQPNAPRPWGPSFEDMAAAARAAFPATPVGGGTLSYFTELNRKRPPTGLFDFVTHTVCPIVHAADDLSVMETLESLPSIIASSRAIIGKSPYHWGPSSIPCRDNPYGAAVAANPGNGRVCLSDMDPRQRGLFAAAWNLGLAAAAAKGGLDRVTLGAATGPQGAIYVKGSYPQPWFDGGSAQVYPCYHVLAGLAPASGARRIDAVSSAASRVVALAHRSAAGPVLWLANLTSQTQKVKVAGIDGSAAVHMIDEGSFATVARTPDFLARKGAALRRVTSVELSAYAVARIAAA